MPPPTGCIDREKHGARSTLDTRPVGGQAGKAAGAALPTPPGSAVLCAWPGADHPTPPGCSWRPRPQGIRAREPDGSLPGEDFLRIFAGEASGSVPHVNRRRYDAAHTIQAFSARLRQQVDLDTLTTELLGVVDQTMQPTSVSLWLRPAGSAPPTSPVQAHSTRRHCRPQLRGPSPRLCETATPTAPPSPPEQAKAIIAQRRTVPEEVRRRRRSRKTKGKAPQQVLAGHDQGARSAARRPAPSPASLGRPPTNVNRDQLSAASALR